MRCIFCKEDSTSSKSVEHIVPKSMGCKEHTLPAGIVCDKCNNYFAREVEKPFLEETSIKHLRFEAGIESKKGVIPAISGVLNHQHTATIHKELRGNFAGHIDVDSEAFESIMSAEHCTIIFPKVADEMFLKDGAIVSRFIGKVALEAFAQRILHLDLDSFIDDNQFDLLRNHVRRGTQKDWSCYVRRIYEIDKKWVNAETNEIYQMMHEYDFLYTDLNELYFIVAILGMEYAINMGGSSMEGYEGWLKCHNNESPLYYGKNSHG